jgi:hypothetical protein
MQFLSEKLASEGIDGFGLTDKFAIYGAHAFMGLGGLITGYPEVAVETLSMLIPKSLLLVQLSGNLLIYFLLGIHNPVQTIC